MLSASREQNSFIVSLFFYQIDSSALEKFSTVVSFQDGNIDSICSHPNDAAWAVNIKRAVLSMLQHSAQLLEVSEEHVYEVRKTYSSPITYHSSNLF